MDRRLLGYYDTELQHLRGMGVEFAREYPRIAGRLALRGATECEDPYVERLMEGFAFLAARVQVKLEGEFQRFTQYLFETVYPDYLAPTPSMAIVKFEPALGEGSLARGFVLPRETQLRGTLSKGSQTACEYRTAHEVTLWPLEVSDAEYYTRSITSLDLPSLPGVQAGLRLRLKCTAGLTFDKLSLDRLPLYLSGGDERLSMRLHEQLLANTVSIVARPARRPAPWKVVLPRTSVRRVGFEDDQALMPCGLRSFQGYRLLREYFAFPERYRFVELTDLESAVRQCSDSEMDIFVLFDRVDTRLENAVDKSRFALFCTPVVNLFPKRIDRIHLTDRLSEYHVVPDMTRPLDYEIYQVNSVVGFGAGGTSQQEIRPFYACDDLTVYGEHLAYYTLNRIPRLLSERARRTGLRTTYSGSDVYIAIVDGKETPYRNDLRQLEIQALCTNRDLPITMPRGDGRTDFTLSASAPVDAVRCIAGPTNPRPPLTEGPEESSLGDRPHGRTAWRLISHLSLNYLSLIDTDARQGAAGLRELLKLYGDASDPSIQKQIEGLKSVRCAPITRRMATTFPLTFGRGLEVTVLFDEAEFEGIGVFLLGAVLAEFFAKYVSINSFTETVVKRRVGREEVEVVRWPMVQGLRQAL